MGGNERGDDNGQCSLAPFLSLALFAVLPLIAAGTLVLDLSKPSIDREFYSVDISRFM